MNAENYNKQTLDVLKLQCFSHNMKHELVFGWDSEMCLPYNFFFVVNTYLSKVLVNLFKHAVKKDKYKVSHTIFKYKKNNLGKNIT